MVVLHNNDTNVVVWKPAAGICANKSNEIKQQKNCALVKTLKGWLFCLSERKKITSIAEIVFQIEPCFCLVTCSSDHKESKGQEL